ncbi:MAG TPA: DUF3667 domain-containing protein, partial [Pyrinomonadaceae bacterium]|nr:DUF3667 domain-containing protein [Pyrinomonadaceae bacterium]
GAPATPCPSCGETLVGEFCHRCGERSAGARDLTLRHFVAEAAQEFTSVEHSKMFRTLRALLLRPGLLTVEWAAGRRNLYLKPLNLCLLILTLQVFVYSTRQVSTFDFGRIIEMEKQLLASQGISGRSMYDRLVEGVAAERGATRETVLERINERWSRNVSFFQVPLVLAYALMLQLFYLFSRRHFVEHVVFSLHFIAFTSLTVVLMWPLYYAVGIAPTAANMWVAVGKFLLDIAYLFVAARVFYRDTSGWALVKAPAMFAAYFVIYVLTYIAALFASIYSVARW